MFSSLVRRKLSCTQHGMRALVGGFLALGVGSLPSLPAHAEQNAILASASALPPAMPDFQHQIMQVTDRGIEPTVLRMKLEDSILFILNKTRDSLVTMQIDFGKKTTHCASSNLGITENGVIHSLRPFSPRDFASVCFHDRGTYPVTILGIKNHPTALSATVFVE